MAVEALHLHTYFLFPFSIDREAVMEDHQQSWRGRDNWFDGLDDWIASHGAGAQSPIVTRLGGWRRAAYRAFDMESVAYQDMVFFHNFVRRVFFDTGDALAEPGEQEALLRCYSIPLEERRVWMDAEDRRGRSATVEVTDLRLFLFANGIGILSIGVEALHMPVEQALWVNEMMRKVYPSSGRQIREGRVPCRTTLFAESPGGAREVIVEERFPTGHMIGFLPPLSAIIKDLLYFAEYAKQEFEPVLDERMIVYSYLAVDPASVPPGFKESEDYQILLSRLLCVDHYSSSYRYEPGFTRKLLDQQVYRRWAHQGTYYGFTSYSNVVLTVGTFQCDDHLLREGFLIHRMFDGRYYLMSVILLLWRAVLLDFSERVALVSRRLFRHYGAISVEPDDLRLATQLNGDFQHFLNYWYFGELANKDEELEHFEMQRAAYRIEPMVEELESEIQKLSDTLDNVYQIRNTEAVNRLAMLSMILGGGAMITGYFGMNFGRGFADVFFDARAGAGWPHVASVVGVSLLVLGALLFGIYLILANWADYRKILLPASRAARLESLRRVIVRPYDEESPEQ